MDHIWHMEGMDLRMTPYTCLATGHQVGVIQVVSNAKTVYQIQRKAGKLAAIQVDSTQLYKWIKSHNENNVDQALETFTRSCAGYCVATFILGIGDRHPDNIMVRLAVVLALLISSKSNFPLLSRSTKTGKYFTSTSATFSVISRKSLALAASEFHSSSRTISSM